MKTIILNKLYVGNYLKDEKNIGHEVINLFRDDNEKNYIYITPSGYLSKEYDDTVEAVLLVENLTGNRAKVIAKATCLKQIAYNTKDLKEKQIAFIKENNIKYGEVFLDKLMDDVRVTFEAESVIMPIFPIYLEITEEELTRKDNTFYLKDYKIIVSEACRRYVSDSDKNFRILEELINDPSLWKGENTTKRITINDSNSIENKEKDFSFIKLIRKEHDELIYSNMISFFLAENPELFKNFCKEILDIETEGDYSINREEANIDILIRDKNYIIVIENKIKSGINGITKAKNGMYPSQLSKYFDYVKSTDDCKKKGKKSLFFIFAPNYNKPELEALIHGKDYKTILYSELYKFFLTHGDNIKSDLKKYYDDFVKSLKMHKEEVDNSNFETMKRRFINAIKSVKGN